MLGTIIGDIVGSRFEWNNIKTKEFELLTGDCRFTDDSVMTLAVARALSFCMQLGTVTRQAALNYLPGATVDAMCDLGRKYPDAGYGGRFARWLREEFPQPYQSYGNGAAMRVSPCGFAAASLEDALDLAGKVTAISHDHPEGLRGAKATAAAIYLARTGSTKAQIRAHIEQNYYPLDFTLDEIRPAYAFDVSCQGTVPQALEAFLESTGFEDAIRNAVSIGGDSDTLAAITGGVAEAFYGVPNLLRKKILTYLPDEFIGILAEFQDMFGYRELDETQARARGYGKNGKR